MFPVAVAVEDQCEFVFNVMKMNDSILKMNDSISNIYALSLKSCTEDQISRLDPLTASSLHNHYTAPLNNIPRSPPYARASGGPPRQIPPYISILPPVYTQFCLSESRCRSIPRPKRREALVSN